MLIYHVPVGTVNSPFLSLGSVVKSDKPRVWLRVIFILFMLPNIFKVFKVTVMSFLLLFKRMAMAA